MVKRQKSSISRRRALISAALIFGLAPLSGCFTTTREMTMVGKYEKKVKRIEGHDIAYVEAGEGPPIVFLHGNPTSSYIWRNIIPYAEPYGRCIALDLIGMGDSSKLKKSGPQSYTFAEHAHYLDAFLEALGVEEDVTLVVHDWGAALGFDWARRHPDAVRSIAHMEAYFIPQGAELQQKERTPLFDVYFTPEGERFILQDNGYVEKVLLASLNGKLKTRDVAAYRKPFLKAGEDRRVVLSWAQQVPFAGKPATTWDVISDYTQWLETTDFPKLFIRGQPGSIVQGQIVNFVSNLPNQRQIIIPAGHYIQEDQPEQVGKGLESWLENDVGLERKQTPASDIIPDKITDAFDFIKNDLLP